MYETVKIQMDFQSSYCVCVCVCMYKWIHVHILEKSLRIKVFIFPFAQNMKKTTMVKVGYYCMKQMMIWDNVVMFPFH